MSARDVLANHRIGYPKTPDGLLLGSVHADAILSAIEAAGYAVVPTIPTDKMVIAGGEAQSRSIGSWGEPKLVWQNMIDAAKLSETKQKETP